MENMNNINEWRLCELIALLTEHCRKHYWFKDNDDIEIDHDSVQFHLYHNAKRYFSIGVEKVICKEFWFIQWLFDKDKIDWSKFHKYSFYKKDNKFIQYYDWQSLLMALSISDTPIEDLISYLR